MSLQRDHHGIVAEVVKPQNTAMVALTAVLVLVLVLALTAGSILAATEASIGWALFSLVPAVAISLAILPSLSRSLRRVVVRLTQEYLVVEESLPLRPPSITRVALSRIYGVKLRWTTVVLEVDSLGVKEITIDCPELQLRGPLLEAIRQAIAAAPGPSLRKAERPPAAIEQLRAERVREKA